MEARTVCLDTSTKEFATRNYFGVAVFLASPCVERRPLCRCLAALKRDSRGRARSARARPPTTLTNIRSFVNAVSLSVALFSRHGTTHSSHVPVISQSYHRRQGNPARMILQIRDNSRGTRISSRFVDVLVSSMARCLAPAPLRLRPYGDIANRSRFVGAARVLSSSSQSDFSRNVNFSRPDKHSGLGLHLEVLASVSYGLVLKTERFGSVLRPESRSRLQSGSQNFSLGRPRGPNIGPGHGLASEGLVSINITGL